jgi:hypothetical protein
VQTFTEKLMTFGLGRGVDYHDMPTIRRIVRQAAPDNYRFSSLVVAIASSEQFRMRTTPGSAIQTAGVSLPQSLPQ